jgi:serine protease inhibitor
MSSNIILQDFNETGVHKNIFVSPSSIYETLLLAYFGSGGQTEAELSEVLGFNSDNSTTTKDDVKKSYLFRRAFQVTDSSLFM